MKLQVKHLRDSHLIYYKTDEPSVIRRENRTMAICILIWFCFVSFSAKIDDVFSFNLKVKAYCSLPFLIELQHLRNRF